jgi:hypothetical protein
MRIDTVHPVFGTGAVWMIYAVYAFKEMKPADILIDKCCGEIHIIASFVELKCPYLFFIAFIEKKMCKQYR